MVSVIQLAAYLEVSVYVSARTIMQNFSSVQDTVYSEAHMPIPH